MVTKPPFRPLRLLTIITAGLCLSAVHGALRPIPKPKPAPAAVPLVATGEVAAPAALNAATVDEWNRAGTAQIVDARLPEEFAQGHIPFSVNLPLAAFMGAPPESLTSMDPAMKTVVYCGGGDCDASKKVKEMLEAFGFTEVVIYEEGWPGWVAFGGEVEVSEAPK